LLYVAWWFDIVPRNRMIPIRNLKCIGFISY